MIMTNFRPIHETCRASEVSKSIIIRFSVLGFFHSRLGKEEALIIMLLLLLLAAAAARDRDGAANTHTQSSRQINAAHTSAANAARTLASSAASARAQSAR
jgi:hypothetical protein